MAKWTIPANHSSPLTEGRGLKLPALRLVQLVAVVAPHGGAWIETGALEHERCVLVSPLTEGRGLKRVCYLAGASR